MAKVEDLYRKKKEASIEVMGVEFKVHILSGVEYLDAVGEAMDEQGKPSRSLYARNLIGKCVIEPAIDVDKLDAIPLALLLGKLEELHGASGDLSKKLSSK